MNKILDLIQEWVNGKIRKRNAIALAREVEKYATVITPEEFAKTRKFVRIMS